MKHLRPENWLDDSLLIEVAKIIDAEMRMLLS